MDEEGTASEEGSDGMRNMLPKLKERGYVVRKMVFMRQILGMQLLTHIIPLSGTAALGNEG